MTAPTFTADGIQIQTFQEIFDDLVTKYQGIYGADINVGSESPDGQRIALEAQARLDMQSFAATIANSLDPDFAEGLALISIAKLSGIYPRPATTSSWDIAITTDINLTLPDLYTIKDSIGQLWQTNGSANLTTGVNTVSFFAVEFGAIVGLAAYTFEQVTIVLGITLIDALIDAVTGIDEETTQEFRQRRLKSLGNPSYSVTGSLYAKIAQIGGVTDANIIENDTDATDANGVPEHSIWCVIEGGDVTDIAETLAKNITGGTGHYGSVSETYEETLQKPSGATFVLIHEVNFDRPTVIDAYITVTLTRKTPSDLIDLDLVKAQLEAVTFAIGEAMLAGSLYQYCFGAGDGYTVTALEISDDDITYVDTKLTPAVNEKYELAAARITITELGT